MLSSTVESRLVFEMLMEDLSSLATGHGHDYELRAIRIQDGKARMREVMRPSDFIVRAEDFGVPQKRHRVIIIGLRSDLAKRAAPAEVAVAGNVRTVGDAIQTLPALRSGISRGGDDAAVWRDEVVQAAELLAETTMGEDDVRLHEAFASLADRLEAEATGAPSSSVLPDQYGRSNDELLNWLQPTAPMGFPLQTGAWLKSWRGGDVVVAHQRIVGDRVDLRWRRSGAPMAGLRDPWFRIAACRIDDRGRP